eukprot:518891-Prorocentrum_minimum.AAC.3
MKVFWRAWISGDGSAETPLRVYLVDTTCRPRYSSYSLRFYTKTKTHSGVTASAPQVSARSRYQRAAALISDELCVELIRDGLFVIGRYLQRLHLDVVGLRFEMRDERRAQLLSRQLRPVDVRKERVLLHLIRARRVASQPARLVHAAQLRDDVRRGGVESGRERQRAAENLVVPVALRV